MTSSNITRLNLGKWNLHWCTLGAAVSHQLITTCVCANLLNKYTSQYRVLFRVKQHTTKNIFFYLQSTLQEWALPRQSCRISARRLCNKDHRMSTNLSSFSTSHLCRRTMLKNCFRQVFCRRLLRWSGKFFAGLPKFSGQLLKMQHLHWRMHLVGQIKKNIFKHLEK